MSIGAFDQINTKLAETMTSDDPGGLIEYMAFPFTLVEDDFTLVLHTTQDVRDLHSIYNPAMGGVEYYNISDVNLSPISSALYLATYSVSVSFGNGHKRDRAKRALVLGERNGITKAISSMAFLGFATEWLGEHAPEKLEEIKRWEN